MNCDEVRKRLPLWVGGDLPGGEQAGVDDHLAGCPACRAEADAWRTDHERMVEFTRRDDGPGLEPTRLEEMITAAREAAASRAVPARRPGFWRWAGPVAALFAVFLFWRLVPLPDRRPEPAPQPAAGAASWEQLQAAFDGCLERPVRPEAWRAEAGPGLVTVLTRTESGDGYRLADCIEVSDLRRIRRYPWLEQRLEKYRRNADGGIYLAVCNAGEWDRGRRRAVRDEVLRQFGAASRAS